MGNLRIESKRLSNNLSIITAREDFTSQMINTLSDGAAKLTEADMNEEGANILMLQTRQALGTTSLNLASQAAQNVLRLF
jgi:flagellin